MVCPIISYIPIAAIIHMGSVHVPERNYENTNIGIGLQSPCSNNVDLQYGIYKNSIGNPSAYIGAVYEPKKIPVFVSISFATGYGSYPTPIPMIGLRYKFFRIGLVPYAGRINDSAVIHFMMKVSR